jgi:phosphatidylglycerophosphatase A
VTTPPSGPPATPAQRLLIAAIATFFGAGHSPIWPGTAGTIAAVPLAYFLLGVGRLWLFAATVVLFIVGTWAAGRYCELTGKHDNRRVVIDEVVGYLLCMWAVPRTLPNLLAAFVLFRTFDTWKPWPIRLVDRRVKGGFGVMADDVLAGALAALLLWLAQPYIPEWLAHGSRP